MLNEYLPVWLLRPVKKTAFFMLETAYAFRALLPARRRRAFRRDEAERVLRNAGYDFPRIFDVAYAPLLPDTLDLSIVVPVYNGEKFLRNCIDSLLAQRTRYSFEIICVNDGSTDSCAAILSEYAAKSDKVKVYSQENQGISAARNVGIAHASGRYIGFVDNDDTVTPDYVETILNAAMLNDADIVQTGHFIVKTDGTVLNTVSEPDRLIECTAADNIIMKTKGYIWGGCLRKRLFENARFPLGFWFEDMVTCMIYVRMAKRIVMLAAPLYINLVHGNNASRTIWKTRNVKSIDQFWLALQCDEFTRNVLKLPQDNVAMTMLLREWSAMLLKRTAGLPDDVHAAFFALASDYVKSLNFSYRTTNRYYRQIYKSLIGGNYARWKNLARALAFANDRRAC